MSASVHIRTIRFDTLAIPFKVAFRHASAERSETSSVWIGVESDDGLIGRGESCPRPYVTGESLDSARAFVSANEASLREEVTDLASLGAWMTARQADLDEQPAAWCAIELAVLDLLGRAAGITVEALLGQPPLGGRFRYTAILGDMGAEAFAAMAVRYRAQGFTDVKVKLSGDLPRDRAKVDVLRAWPDVRVRADANNLWRTAEEAASFLEALEYPFFALEEPIAVPGKGPRAAHYRALADLGARLDSRIVLDESFLRASQIVHLAADPGRWVVNLRVSKMGGLLRSLEVIEAARRAGVGLIVGAQVGETSLLTRAGLAAASAAGDLLVAQEGAFGTHLLERDVCDPPLMFGAGGGLDTAAYPSLAGPGWGLGL